MPAATWWKSYGATTRETYRCDFCGASSQGHLLGWRYRSVRPGRGIPRWTQRICPACSATRLPYPGEQIHRSASAP